MVLDRRLWRVDVGALWIVSGMALPIEKSAGGIENGPILRQGVSMTLELPDAETRNLTPQELRLELACALYARGRIGNVGGANLAGVDFFMFQRALGERQISSYTAEMLHEDVETMKKLFPE